MSAKLGYSKDFPLERLYRDAPLLIIEGGTSQQQVIIARNLVRKYSVQEE